MRKLPVATIALALLTGPLLLAGCGGGGSNSGNGNATTTKAAASSGQNAASGDDCQTLSFVGMDLAAFDTTGSGFDYASDRDFLDGYASRAPGGVAASVRRMRDLVDRLASAAQDAGVTVGSDPTEDQLNKMRAAVHFSSDEQAANAAALSQVAVYAGTSC